MPLRDKIRENPAIPVVSMLLALAVCGYFLWGLVTAHNPGKHEENWVGFYTIDDGATVFVDNHPPSAPFQKDGRDAVLAVMFTCDYDKTRFCGYLVKKAPAPAIAADGKHVAPGHTLMMNYIKKPGDTEWIPESDYGRWAAIEKSVKCPPGAREPITVTPANASLRSPQRRP